MSDAPVAAVAGSPPRRKAQAPALAAARIFRAPEANVSAYTPATPAVTPNGDDELLAAVTLNSRAVSPGVPLLRRSGKLHARASDLDAWRILWPPGAAALEQDGAKYVQLAAIPGLAATFDPRRQQLDLEVEASSFRPVDVNAFRAAMPVAKPPSDIGAFLGYGLSAYRASGVDAYSGLFGGGVFGPFGVLTTDALGNWGGADSNFVRLDSTLRYDMPQRMQTLLAGDSILSPVGPWGRAVRIGGIQFGTNFGTQPAFRSTPLQSISGTAAVPSVVDILVNGQLIGQRKVPAGNFTFNDIPYVTGAGNVQAVVRDPLGREQVYADSYYLSSRLLAKGLDQWGIEAGALRYEYGTKSADYRDFIGGAYWRRGFTDWVTGEVRTRMTPDVRLAGGAVDATLFELVNGTISAAWSNTDAGSGGVYGIGFQRTGQRGPTFSVQYFGADSKYRDPSDPGDYLGFRTLASASAGLPLGRFGSIVAGYTRSTFWGERPEYSLGTLSYYLTLPGYVFVSFNVAHGISGMSGTTATLNVTVPFGDRRTSASAGLAWNSEAERAGRRSLEGQASIMRSIPVGNGYGYRVTARDSGDLQAIGTVQNEYAQLQGEAGRWFGNDYGRVTLSGGAVFLGGRASLARDVTQSFAVVDANGVADAPIYVNNQFYGKTADDGMIVVPRLPAYSPNTIGIRQKDFPISYSLGETTQMVTPYYRSGSIVRFRVERVREATARLLGPEGKPLPAGTPIFVNGSGEVYVGLDGEVFLRNLGASNAATARTGGATCNYAFAYPTESADLIPDLGALKCAR